MFKKSKKHYMINKLNQKWAGKEFWFCNKIYSDILFALTKIRSCCHSTAFPYAPPILYMEDLGKFSYSKYIYHTHRIMNLNQTEKSVCEGCKYLKKQIVPEFKKSGNLKFVTINHFTKCNANCIYCSNPNKNNEITYEMFPIIKHFHKLNMFDKDCLFNWGGGEPVICSEFAKISDYLIKNNYKQVINSSGLEFSEIILNGLKNNLMSIQISPDAGTEETYAKIKGQNGFYTVWENIKKYSTYKDNMLVKFVIFSMNSFENEIYKFVELCSKNGVKNIVIDAESNSSNGDGKKFGPITQKEVDMAILLKKLSIENNINYSISYQWNEENKDKIETSL